MRLPGSKLFLPHDFVHEARRAIAQGDHEEAAMLNDLVRHNHERLARSARPKQHTSAHADECPEAKCAALRRAGVM